MVDVVPSAWTVACIGAVRAHPNRRELGHRPLDGGARPRRSGTGPLTTTFAEAQAPEDVEQLVLFTGAHSARNLAMDQRAGYRVAPTPAPPGAVGLVKAR